ncbi:MAG: TlpA disulfide reductase family protein [Acidobacteriota bacterium]
MPTLHILSRIAVAVSLGAALTACSSSSPDELAKSQKAVDAMKQPLEDKIKPVAERQKAPAFELKDATGVPVTLALYKDKVVLLNFWATWCVPCKAELPWFQEFESKYKDQGFAVVGISMDEDGWKAVKPFIEEHKLSYRMVVGNERVGTLYGGIDSLPQTFMIDRQGKIASIHTGLVSKATYQKEIDELLSGGIVEDKKDASLFDTGGASQLAFFRAK